MYFFQRMLDANLIMHASQSEAQCFVDGMFLFFIKSTEKADGKKNFNMPLFAISHLLTRVEVIAVGQTYLDNLIAILCRFKVVLKGLSREIPS